MLLVSLLMTIVDENERCNNAAVSQCGAVLHPGDVLVAVCFSVCPHFHIFSIHAHTMWQIASKFGPSWEQRGTIWVPWDSRRD